MKNPETHDVQRFEEEWVWVNRDQYYTVFHQHDLAYKVTDCELDSGAVVRQFVLIGPSLQYGDKYHLLNEPC